MATIMATNMGMEFVDWLLTFLRTFFMTIDAAIFILIDLLFYIVVAISRFEFVGLYELFESNIYTVLGIFMLFKIIITMLSYLVNPDKVSDKQEGASKIVTRIIVSMVMLILLPTFFDLTTEFENKVMPVIPQVIVGTKDEMTTESAGEVAEQMTLSLLQGLTQDRCPETGVKINSISDYIYRINDTCQKNGSQFRFGYIPIIPTIVGLFMLFALFSMGIQLSIRIFKLLILRMLAPIPIISYMDPKSSKDGMFSTWVKTFLQTWLEVFINVAVIYIVIYIIGFIMTSGAVTVKGLPAFGTVIFVAFLIIGLLMFAKSAPNFIYQALGLKSKHNFVRMLGMGAAAIGGIGSTIGAYRARTQADKNNGIAATGRRTALNLGASLFNGLGSIYQGGSAVVGSDNPNLRTGLDIQQANDVKAKSRIMAGVGLGDRLLAGFQTTMGLSTDFDKLNNQIEDYKNVKAAYGRIEDALNSYGDRKVNSSELDYQDGWKKLMSGKTGFNEDGDYYSSTGEKLFDHTKSYSTKDLNDLLNNMQGGNYSADDRNDINDIRKFFQDDAFNDIRARGASGEELDGAASQIYSAAQEIYKTGKEYANAGDKVFAAYQNIDSLGAKTYMTKDEHGQDIEVRVSLGGEFKGVAANAGREAAKSESSPEYKKGQLLKNSKGK